MSDQPVVALTIAGSDSGAGAGLQADLKTMAALGVFAVTAVTAVTAQNTVAVRAVHPVPTEMVDRQIDAVLEDLEVRAVKTGMLATVETIGLVGRRAAAGDLPALVVDPVLVASTGRPLLGGDGVLAYRRLIAPSALVMTPNLWEAALLADVDAGSLTTVEAMADAGRRIRGFGSRWVLVKGGHLPGVEPGGTASAPGLVPDVLVGPDGAVVVEAPHVATSNVHGTGCSLSAAVAAGLAGGADVPAAVVAAKAFVAGALAGSASWHLGAGHGPLDHLGPDGRAAVGHGGGRVVTPRPLDAI